MALTPWSCMTLVQERSGEKSKETRESAKESRCERGDQRDSLQERLSEEEKVTGTKEGLSQPIGAVSGRGGKRKEEGERAKTLTKKRRRRKDVTVGGNPSRRFQRYAVVGA